MTRAVNTEAHEALRVAEYLRVALARDEFTQSEREDLMVLYVDNVAKAIPALFPHASSEQVAEYAPYVRKALNLLTAK